VSASLACLAAIFFVAFAVEASLGFGSALIAISFGSLLVGVDQLLPAFMPLSLALSLYVAGRYRGHIAGSLLLRRILPGMLIGLPIGLLAFNRLPAPLLRRALGAFVLVLSALELWRFRRARPDERPPRLGALTAFALLVLGGVAHGAFATGGPIAVYVAGREVGDDKSSFRSTLSALWLVLIVAMIGSYAWMGRFTAASTQLSATLAIPLVLGLLAGEALHARLPLRTFQRLVFALVGLAGLLLLVGIGAR
jgi:uncharacterized membrane protein YfcA